MRRFRSIALGNLARASYNLGQHERAQELNTQAMALAEQAGGSYAKIGVLGLESELALIRGAVAHAAALSRENIALGWEFGDKWMLAPGLEMAAAIMVAAGRSEAAARLYGAGEALREAIAAPMGASDQPEYARHLAALRATLDESSFTRAWQEGRRLPLATAVAEAVGVMATIASDQSASIATASPTESRP